MLRCDSGCVTREKDQRRRETRVGRAVGQLRREVTCHFRVSLNHKDDKQTKFIKPNSRR